MGFWQSLIGTKPHCAGCGQVIVPDKAIQHANELYCSEACFSQVVRLSSVPPQPSPTAQGAPDPTRGKDPPR